MKRAFHIALIDLKIMVQDKVFFFWTLLFPLVFILIFGNIYKDDSRDIKASLTVFNQDQGHYGDRLVSFIESPTILLTKVKQVPKKARRVLYIPADFSEKLEKRMPQRLILKLNPSASAQASAQIESKVDQAMTRMIFHLFQPDPESQNTEASPSAPLIQIRKDPVFENRFRTPSGFDHVIPGILVHFIMMMVLIYGGVVVMTDRQKGILNRIMFSPASTSQLWGGKFLARLLMGLLQSAILVAIGLLFFNLNLGNTLISILIILIFSMTIASLSILIGSLIEKEDLVIGLSILAANIFAALGGCWWPIEVVPKAFRLLGHLSPAYWAMDGFHKTIFFQKNFGSILINLLILLFYTVLFTVLSIRFFKIRK